MICSSVCADFELVEIKSSACKLQDRKTNIKAVGFYKCDVVLPSPLTCLNIAPLMLGDPEAEPAVPKSLVFSNELVNVTVNDPETEERKISDCRPAEQAVVAREITFQDRIAVNINSAGESAPFADYAFWKEKKQHRYQLNYVFVMCNGDLIVPKDELGNPLSAVLDAFINYETLTNGGAIEFKQGSLRFLGDPFDFNAPALNLSTCTAVNGLW